MKSRIIISTLSLVLLFSLTGTLLIAQDSGQSRNHQKYWVFFSDKGELSEQEIDARLDALQRDATVPNLQKRAVVQSRQRLFDYTDLNIHKPYLDSLESLNIEIHRTTKWLNAASVSADQAQIDDLPSLDFVDSIRPVRTYSRDISEYQSPGEALPKIEQTYDLDYGQSFEQLQQIGVPAVHNLGFSGEGVLIGVFDTGFDPSHPAFLGMDIEATYDFINDDTDVRDEFDLQRSHGTSVLSVIGGYAPGEIIGPAYNATYCLAKTEIVTDEIQVEEDNFIAALEWADSIGCRIVSSSLGYILWYTPEDMDGNTALITIASDLAVTKGMNVIVSAGNEGPGETSIIAPADGDYVLAIGGVLINDEIWYASSRGPTADGRIKPDVCANSSNVYVASYVGGYKRSSGTSYAAPLAAGAAALLIESDPTLTSFDIIEGMRSSARQVGGISYPNNAYGYGIVDIQTAIGFEPPEFETAILAFPNPFQNNIQVNVKIEGAGRTRISIHTLDGIQVWNEERDVSGPDVVFSWDGRNVRGEELANGVYLMFVEGPGVEDVVKLVKINPE
ncbi:MAG: S8 family serine peptidase [candidate division Zixibacteria bacterium]|nr:S8 family serine peptidase [candidate division Zixibacteria bacterium]NIR62755.1 S8 family serine peptidase [candidate division Zixibacteria bacterium]NIS17207.1 S8 family serine peptidase [candidate division Zixibacteria bacterium]NIS44825.1 S8 family serine peptidase [candidate division Zixibacteria bacterium]NIT53560.1 S8 family serine peptidase [candidate division Zixibacteria bacterium]